MHLVTFERRRPRAVSATSRAALELASGGLEGLEEPPALGRRVGALLGPDEVVDLNRALALKFAVEDAGAPEAEADSLLPAEPLEMLRSWEDVLPEARAALAFVEGMRRRWDGPDLADLGVIEPRGEVHLHAPVPRPGKVIGVARNYAAHAAEQGDAAPPEEPVLFLKASSSVIGPDGEILLPAASRCVDYEGELAVVIGRRTREVAAAAALDHVAGYTVANDVSARDFQNTRGQRFIGKSFDTFAPLGPALVTRDEIPDPQGLGVRTRVSGEILQDGNTKEMLFPVAELVAFASRIMTLEPGDVLLTGTPAGVGQARRPPRWLRDGDVVEVRVERVGTLRSYVRAAGA